MRACVRVWKSVGLLSLALFVVGCPQFDGENNTSVKEDVNQGTSTTVLNSNRTSTGVDPRKDSSVAQECAPVLTFDGAPSATSVTVAGEFNDWNETDLPMERVNGRWVLPMGELSEGHYAYKFVVDGVYEEQVPPSVYTKWSGGTENRNLMIPDCSAPSWRLLEHQVSGEGKITASLKFLTNKEGDALDPDSVKVTLGDLEITPTIDVKTNTLQVEYQAPAEGKYSLRAWGKDVAGHDTRENPLWVPMWYEKTPFEWQDATMYLIFTDRFLDSDGGMPVAPIQNVSPIAGYMGGDFNGIVKKLDEGYFKEMGVNLLWLSPIYENTEQAWSGSNGQNQFTGFHGYWPIKPLTAESRYGDAEASADARLKELIDKAHAQGIRVLFDVVHNHVHKDHTYCKENPDWCAITGVCGTPGWAWEGPDGKPIECQFASYLPDLNYKNHAILRRQIKDTLKLGEMFDIDGYRVDAAKHMNHIIMRTLRLKLNDLEAIGATPFYAVGETYTGGDGYGLIMQYVADYELHGQFDFPLLYPMRDVFGRGGSFRGLEDAVIRSENAYGDAYTWMSPFLGNHDIERFSTYTLQNDGNPWDSSVDVMAQGPADSIDDAQWNLINRTSMGFAFLLTQPGVPLIYYGDEIGLGGSGDPDNRRMMIWDHNAGQKELLNRVKQLSKARRLFRPLRRGTRQQLWVDDSMYVYARVEAPGEVVLVAMNKGDKRTEDVTIPNELGISGKTLTSYNSAREVVVNGTTLSLSLDPWEYAIFTVKP